MEEGREGMKEGAGRGDGEKARVMKGNRKGSVSFYTLM